MAVYLELLARCTLSMSAVTLALLAFTPLLIRRYSARTGYCAWLLALLGYVVPLRPRLTYWVSASQASGAAQAVPAEIPIPPVWGGDFAMLPWNSDFAILPVAAETAWSWQRIAFLVWLAGVVIAVALHIRGHIGFAGMVRRWSEPVNDSAALALLREERERLGISREIGLRQCGAVHCPMLAGLLRPVILLPDLPDDREELALILRHELVHYSWWDLPARALMVLAVTVHWFNPLAHLAARRAATLCERACDARVLQGTDDETRRRYCAAILRWSGAGRRLSALTTAYAGGAGGLRRRLAAILEAGPKRRGGWIVLVVGAAAILAGATWVAETRPAYDASIYISEEAAAAAEEVSSLAETGGAAIDDVGQAYATRQDFLSSFEAVPVEISGGQAPRHSLRNGQLALYSRDGGEWALHPGDVVSITVDIDPILADGHTAGIGYELDGVYTEMFSGKLGFNTTVTFQMEQAGDYRLFLSCVSSDPIRVERLQVDVAPGVPGSTSYLSYTVREGDTPVGIAVAFNIGLDTLLQCNPDMLDTLMPGQVLRIPQGTGSFISPIAKATGTPYLYYLGEGALLVIPCADKTPVYATRGGTVVLAQEGYTGYGHQVVIDHGDGHRTRYGYCATLDVAVGDRVEQGQQIALSGSTGRAVEQSLLFQIHYNDRAYNPLDYIVVE